MNILGQNFDTWVTNQVNFRQKSLGLGSGRSAKDLQYQQSKTPWVRLASSIDVKGDDGVKAKELILQGGARTSDSLSDLKDQRFGVTPSLNSKARGAYGWGGDRERGYVPMPGITNATVKYINNGALSKSEVTIKCYSKKQFELIDELYMRPGYTLLLEFGWTTYLDSKGKPQSFDGFKSPALRGFLEGNDNQYDVVKKIQKEREKRAGNYEGVFGKVTNFKWNFNPDGSYDIIVDIVGIGDVIETLKINSSLNKKEEDPKGEDTKDSSDSEVPLIDNATQDSLSQWLFQTYQEFSNNGGSGNWKGNKFDPVDGKIKSFRFESSNYKLEKTLTIEKAVVYTKQAAWLSGGAKSRNETGNPQVFIKFSFLLAWLQKNIMLNSGGIPNTVFDINFEYLGEDNTNTSKADLTLFNCLAGNLSSDPMVCLIPFKQETTWGGIKLNYSDDGYQYLPERLNKEYAKQFRYDKYNGRISQILINQHFIAQCLQDTTADDNGAKPLLEFLNNVISGVNKALGSVNNITVKLNQDQTKIQFIEDAPQILDKPIEKGKACTFETFGISNPNLSSAKGSFIRNITLDGSIPSNFAAMVTIGAQANGNQTSGNATSFSKYNQGLIDRIIPVKTSEGDDDKEKETPAVMKKNQEKKINTVFKKIDKGEGFFQKAGITAAPLEVCYDNLEWAVEKNQTFNNLHNQLIQLLTGYLSNPKSEGGLGLLPAPFFLPFNLSLEMDGISGIKLYETFRVDGKVLPPSYDKDKIKLIVKGTNHNIDGSAWTTTLETQSTPTAE
jgi:hypothetical protein